MAAAHSQAPSAQSKRHSVYERYLFKVCWLFSLKTYELGLAVSPNFNFDLSPGRLQRFSLPNAGRNHSPCAVPTTLDDSVSDLLTWRPDFFQPLALKEGINDASMEMWLPKLELCLTFLLSSGEFSLVFKISTLSHYSVLPYHCFLSFFHNPILSLLMASFCHAELFQISQKHLSHLFFLLLPSS